MNYDNQNTVKIYQIDVHGLRSNDERVQGFARINTLLRRRGIDVQNAR